MIMANSAQAALNIFGGSFQGDIQTGTAHGLSISGGYFTADPTSYLVSGKDAVASNQDGYQYMVGTLALSQQTLALTKGGEAVLSVNAEPGALCLLPLCPGPATMRLWPPWTTAL